MIRNDFGPIARTYEELQSLPTLAQSQLRCPVRPTSRAAFDRAVLQSVEIALYNVADLLTRATADLRKGDVGRAGLKAAWLHGFQKVITQLLVGYKQLPFRSNRPSVPLSLPDVAPYQSALAALKSFDAAVVSTVGYERFTNILGSGNLDGHLG